jgi:hypothetical protein
MLIVSVHREPCGWATKATFNTTCKKHTCSVNSQSEPLRLPYVGQRTRVVPLTTVRVALVLLLEGKA